MTTHPPPSSLPICSSSSLPLTHRRSGLLLIQLVFVFFASAICSSSLAIRSSSSSSTGLLLLLLLSILLRSRSVHKMWDVVPLDINADVWDSDEDNDHPVFDFQDKDDGDDDDSDDIDDARDTGMAAKIVRQHKFLQEKFGGVEDEMHDDDKDDDEKEKKVLWGGMKNQYYYGDNHDFELKSSDDESLAEEEEEVLRMQKERAKTLEMEDFGLQDVSDSDRELTLEVKKDLNALSKEEQIDVVYSSAPELVGLLSELNDALEQLENKVNPLLSKVKEQEVKLEGGMRYLEDGQPVGDHPVIARLVEIKGLQDKMKELDGNLPYEVDEFLKKGRTAETGAKLIVANEVVASAPVTKINMRHLISQLMQNKCHWYLQVQYPLPQIVFWKKDHTAETGAKLIVGNEVVASAPITKDQYETPHLSADAKQASLVLASSIPSTTICLLEKITLGLSNGHVSSSCSSKLSQLATARPNKAKVIRYIPVNWTKDADLLFLVMMICLKGMILEKDRKHELRVLAGAGIKSKEDGARDELGTLNSDEDGDMEEGDTGESEDEFYKQVKEQRAAKLAAKAEIYTRALLAKQVWRIIRKPISLVARDLKTNYFSESTILEAIPKSRGSLVWQGLMWGCEIITRGSRWRIGRGDSVRVYGDRWVPRPPTFKIISPMQLDEHVTVDCLKTEFGGWNVELIQIVSWACDFLENWRSVLSGTKISSTKMKKEICRWRPPNEGVYKINTDAATDY
ncbi:hypothetical protein Ddye_013362 [Dipteronia dyeriana]|uniref:Uncharacterized protein n=1 Tax=Dipteronia dyeriana TaxID=168575 RepID=A0AAD9X5Z2_9ROSI|nr:hypothetical protein Ddye_013362 [Dipteronia dyeriana]